MSDLYMAMLPCSKGRLKCLRSSLFYAFQDAETSGTADAARAETSPLLAAAFSETARERPVTAADLPIHGVKEKATFGPKKFRPKR